MNLLDCVLGFFVFLQRAFTNLGAPDVGIRIIGIWIIPYRICHFIGGIVLSV